MFCTVLISYKNLLLVTFFGGVEGKGLHKAGNSAKFSHFAILMLNALSSITYEFCWIQTVNRFKFSAVIYQTTALAV